MGISKTISIALQEEIPNPYGTCNACERSGLPILLLREAYAPHPQDTKSYLVAYDSEITHTPLRTNQLRVLRQGYVYVLLDQEIWHAYQVTPEGALRRFPVSQMPLAAGRSLNKHCETKDHDVIASFINIDTQLFSKAWIAFANDPWPRDVLANYREGIASADPEYLDRFVELDLNTARNDPASVGIAMTESELGLGEVLEYATYSTGKFISCHGYYQRMHRLPATRSHVRSIIQKEQLANGLLALTVPDPVGLVMEANAQRTTWFRDMQEWRAEPERHFELFTSQALLGIRELNEARAAVQAVIDTENEAEYTKQWNENPIGFKAYLPPVDVEAKAPRNIERKQQEARERLEERYDEKARAEFQTAYDRELKYWQSMVDKVGAYYTHFYLQKDFQRVGYLDYSATHRLSAEYFIRMMSACLAGGPTELPVHENAELGRTQELWQQLLEDPNSLLYQALLAKHQDLTPQITKALTGNDLVKLHDSIKAFIATPDGERLMIKPIQDAVAQLLAATASAGNALGHNITAKTKALIGHVHSAAFLLFADQPITQVRLSLTIGEYMSLLNEALQQRTDTYLGELDKRFRKPGARKVRAMVLSGAINIAAGGNRNRMVELVFWTLESAENLQARLTKLRDTASGGAVELVRSAAIGLDILRSSNLGSAAGSMISATAAQSLAREAFRSMSNAAVNPKSAMMLLAVGSMWFHQDTLRRNIDLLQLSSEDSELLAAISSSSLGFLGAGVESIGFAVKALQPEKIFGTIKNSIAVGKSIVSHGSFVSALAYIADARQFASAISRTSKQGDADSSKHYRHATGLSIAAFAAGALAAIGVTYFFIPLALSVLFGLLAYGFASLAKYYESEALELWVRRCKWGKPGHLRHWNEYIYLDEAIGALNAAALGVRAEASVRIKLGSGRNFSHSTPLSALMSDGNALPAGFNIDYFFKLPNFIPESADYQWQLNIYRSSNNAEQITLSGGHLKSPKNHVTSGKPSEIFAFSETYYPTVRLQEKHNTLTIQGSIPLVDNHDVNGIELTITYWPDRTDETGLAKTTVREDKISPTEHNPS